MGVIGFMADSVESLGIRNIDWEAMRDNDYILSLIHCHKKSTVAYSTSLLFPFPTKGGKVECSIAMELQSI